MWTSSSWPPRTRTSPPAPRSRPRLMRDLRAGRLAGGRRAAARGQPRPAGAHARQPPGLLPALGPHLGVPGAAQGAAGGRRRRRWRRSGSTTLAAADLARGRAAGGRRGRPRHAPQDHRQRPAERGGPGDQARARVGCATSSSRCSCCSSCTGGPTRRCAHRHTLPALRALVAGGYVGRAGRRGAAARRTASCAASSTACSCSGCGARTPCRTIRRRCGGWPRARLHREPGRDAVEAFRVGLGRPRRARCAGCTRSCSTGRCWRRSPGCPPRRCG